MEQPLVNKKYLLEKYPGKGGWTYAAIPEVLQDPKAHFGWVKVKGSIDGYDFRNFRLMPMGHGKLFLSVNAAVRKKIGKKAGDWVQVVLYADDAPTAIPEELLLCLQDEPAALQAFLGHSDGEQKAFIDWIYAVKKDETKVERIANLLNQLVHGHPIKLAGHQKTR